MADIELLIKIPEELYESYKGRPPMLGDAGMDMIAQSIANGTVLPKRHGRLIDADAYIARDADFKNGGFIESMDAEYFNSITPTIIEADKE